LLEILKGRNFGDQWITWIKNILYSSRTCININGNLGEYFHYKRGVRQGDPLSPFLFDLVSDSFHRFLYNASKEGFLKGISIGDDTLQILNFYFADDTLLFLEALEDTIHSLRWILLGFENISEMKINYVKYEMIPLNISDSEATNLCSLFGSAIGILPITYLGIPLHWKKLTISD
jgi:Reverse transcriptase (RNA-dependent DNA polymerase)